jgi:hypothetical protein
LRQCHQKLDAAAVKDIFIRASARSTTQASLAREYGIDPRTVRDILTGKSWRSVTGMGEVA